MLTVKIFINYKEIFSTSAVNRTPNQEVCIYEVDNGRSILHQRSKGANELAAQLLLLPAKVKKKNSRLEKFFGRWGRKCFFFEEHVPQDPKED